MTEGRDRRQHPRVERPLLVQIRYAAADPPRTVYALNLSESGLFLDVDDGKPVGTRVFVQITAADGTKLLRGEGKVARRADGGVGVALTVDPALRPQLRVLLEDLSPRAP